MPSRTFRRIFSLTIVSLTVACLLLAAGCGNSPSRSNTPPATGSSFVVGTDAPMSAVASFAVQVQSIELTNGSNETASLLSNAQTVDFARYNGLQSLLDMNAVPPGTYTGGTITLGSATLGVLDTTKTPPVISTSAATLTSTTVNFTLANPLVITANAAPVGLRLDFDLQKSIAVDSTGNITGSVTPTFHINAVANTDGGAYIDEFIASVVTPPAGTAEPQSFVVQGPHGEHFTINTTANTEWDGASLSNASLLADLTTSSIVLVSGQLDRADQTLDADEVAILSQSGFYASGLVTSVSPATGLANNFDLYVRGVLPASTGVQLGDIAQVNLNGQEQYGIYFMHNSFVQYTQSIFNQSGLLAGQDIAIGGPATGAASASAVTVNNVLLRHWGYIGTVVPSSLNASNGTFQIKIDGFAGNVIPQTVTVVTGSKTDFRFGLVALSNLLGFTTNVRVVGLLVKDPNNVNNTLLLARHIDGLEFTILP